MKLLSFAEPRRSLWAGAFLLLAGAFSAYSQPTVPNVQVTITLPTNGSVFTGPTNIQIDALTVETNGASDDVVAVSFAAAPGGSAPLPQFVIFLGEASNGVAVGPPASHEKLFSFTWSNAMAGTWSLRAGALGSNGPVSQEAGSPPVIITIERGPVPSVDIASPTNGATFSAPANIQLIAGASESNGAIASVQFFDGLNSLGVVSNGVVVDPPGSPGLPPGSLAYSFDWSNAAVGIHVLTAVAVDAHGQSAVSAPVTISITSNFPPAVRITSPPNNSVFRAPVNIALLAYANDPAGYVSSVEFWAGSNSLGFGLPVPPAGTLPPGPNPPGPPLFQTNTFELIWSNAPPGSNAITAVAIDNAGLSVTSAPVNIVILPQLAPPTNQPETVSIVATDPVAIEGTNCWTWLGLADTNGPPNWSNWMSPAALFSWFTNCGPKDATFAVRRAGGTNGDLTVTYAIGGTASNGVDYVALPGAITIPAGQAESLITLIPLSNATNKAAETVILTLTPSTNNPSNYAIGFPPRAEAIIVDSESPRLALTGQRLGDGSFHLNEGGPDGAWFRVDYTTNCLQWTPLCTNQTVDGSIDFADPDAASSPTRMYRAVPLPHAPSN